MAKEPIIYDPDKPTAHYLKAGMRYKKVKRSIELGVLMPVIAFVCGIASIMYSPLQMAVFALFGISFTMLSIIGCLSRRNVLCFISVPLALVSGAAVMMAGELLSPIGLAAYLLAALAECFAIPAIAEFYALKELPGFPFFHQSMDDISFAAKDHRGAAEFIDSTDFNKDEKTVYRIRPEDVVKSDDMGEVVTGVSLKKEDSAEDEPEFSDVMPELENIPKKEDESTYEKMLRIQPNNSGEMSDVDLFEM